MLSFREEGELMVRLQAPKDMTNSLPRSRVRQCTEKIATSVVCEAKSFIRSFSVNGIAKL